MCLPAASLKAEQKRRREISEAKISKQLLGAWVFADTSQTLKR